MGLKGFTGVDSEGFSGGLALFWHESIEVIVKDATARYIDVWMRISPDEPMFHATFVYGEPRTENRHRMWSSLSTLCASSSLPWALIGDFNEALWSYEHFSAVPRAESQMAAFRDCVQRCGLSDLGFSGLPFTYDNRRAGNNNVQVRLDRALADNAWRDIYSDSTVVHLVTPCSDHCPLLWSLAREVRTPQVRSCLRYEIFWERDAALKEVIETSWKGLGPMQDLGGVTRGLASVMSSLHQCGKRKFGNVTRELARLREKLSSLQASNAPREEIRVTMDLMNEILYREEMLWLQRSRIDWMREGDRNTKVFHQKAVWRARRNKILKLRDDMGVFKTVPSDMQRMSVSHFKFLYTRDPSLDHTSITDLIQEKITEDMNNDLCKEFTDKEIADAENQI
jgi:hypothetical protein